MKSASIPKGWEYVTTDASFNGAWTSAISYKQQRERLRPDLFVRVRVVEPAAAAWWVIKREEPRSRST